MPHLPGVPSARPPSIDASDYTQGAGHRVSRRWCRRGCRRGSARTQITHTWQQATTRPTRRAPLTQGTHTASAVTACLPVACGPKAWTQARARGPRIRHLLLTLSPRRPSDSWPPSQTASFAQGKLCGLSGPSPTLTPTDPVPRGYIYIYIHIYIYTHTHIYIYIYMYICASVQASACLLANCPRAGGGSGQ